jgi:YD repeat-containing protein
MGVDHTCGATVGITYPGIGIGAIRIMVRCVDRAGNVTSHRYDQRGRLTHTDLPTGGTILRNGDATARIRDTHRITASAVVVERGAGAIG